jgi:hypothetical protein
MNIRSSIEPLESRIAPAGLGKIGGTGPLVAKLAGGTLSIIGDPVNDSISMSRAGNSIVVFDGMTEVGTFAEVKNITAILDGPTTLDVDLASGGIPGSFKLTATGPTTMAFSVGSHIGGTLTFTGDATAQTLTLSANMTVDKALTFTGGLGVDTFTIGGGAVIGGSATFTGIENGTFSDATVITIGGSLAFKNATVTLPVVIKMSPFDKGLQVTGALSYAGGSSDDSLAVLGTFGGSATFTDKLGNNTFNTSFGSIIHGAVTMTTGAGDDTFNSQGGAIDKDLTLKLGAGKNQFIYGFAGALTVGGNVTFTTGAGDDKWTGLGSTLSIAKNLTVQLGDGANSVNVAVNVTGPKMLVSTGSGIDTVALYGSAANAVLTVSLGAGADDFTNTLTAARSARYDGGAGLDHWRPDTVAGDPVTLIGFEDFS